MSRRRSARIAVWAAAGVLGAGAITMLAIPATAATPTVTFDGGCSALSSTSSPDRSAVTAQKTGAGQAAQVEVVNALNTAATPYANGKAVTWASGQKVVIDKGDSLTLPFASGPVSLTLQPDCTLLGLPTDLKKDYDAVTISVVEASGETGNPGGGSGGRPGSDSGSGTGSADAPAGTQPDAGDRPIAPHDPAARGAVPPIGDEPAGSTDGEATGDAAPGAGGSDDEADGAGAPMLPTDHNRSPATTTLALVAAVCLLGVAVAALRTLVVVRATRVGNI